MNILNKLTKNYLKLNKKRTIVTIIGIILSGAMISAVTTLAVTFQNYILKFEINDNGDWEARFNNVKYSDVRYIENNNQFKDPMITAEVGMAKNEYSDEDFLYIKQYDERSLIQSGLTLQSGRFPENENEIVLSHTFFDGHENEPKVGDKITLEIGKRIENGIELKSEEVQETEKFQKEQEKTYTICGIIKRPVFEKFDDPYASGITLLNKDILKDDSIVEIFVNTKKPKDIYENTEKVADTLGLYHDQTIEDGSMKRVYNISYNDRVLMYRGVNADYGFTTMLYSVCGILIVVIAVGSILVIYNSFAISVSERKKQFGMLSSVGATKKQIRHSVLYEGSVLGVIGIPIGILSGLGGIWVTLKIVDRLITPLLNIPNQTADWSLSLHTSWIAILIAIALIGITIFMSVIIPARRASKITPIEAIRQNDDIKEIKSKKIKTPKFIRKLFGMEGELALKNLKRSKKRYRTTVISLIISVVLYISVSGFIEYMFKGFDTLYRTLDYDYNVAISVRQDPSNLVEIDNTIHKLTKMEDMKKYCVNKTFYTSMNVPEDRFSDEVKEILSDTIKYYPEFYNEETKTYQIDTRIITLNKEQMEEYLKKVGIKDLNKEEAILMNHSNLLASYQVELDTTKYTKGDILTLELINEEEKMQEKEIHIVKTTDILPFGINDSNMIEMVLIVSEEGYKEYVPKENLYRNYNIAIKTEHTEHIEKQIEEIKKELVKVELYETNVKEAMQQQINLKIIIQIFLYGFIVLISGIGIANIFNTISTNINLRRREFANLKSIGMTDKQFKRMLNLECVFYGTKSLFYGLPIGILICYFINQGFANAVTFIFTLPWMSIITSILAVYLVVFMTMIYSSRKIKNENIVDVLRDDNI